MQQITEDSGGLRRELGVWSAVAIVVGTVIGSGIFIVPNTMVQRLGFAEMVFVVWVVGGLLSLSGALSYAELSAAMPGAGGEYVYLRQAYGPLWSFIYGWTQFWVAKSGSIATLATAFFLYFGNFYPAVKGVVVTIPLPVARGGGSLNVTTGQLMAVALILALAGINYLGVKLGARVQIVVTICKVGLIAFVIGFGLFGGQGDVSNFSSSAPAAGGFLAFFAALRAALWAYDGWNNVSMVASEIRNPQRNLPVSLIWGTVTVMAIYLLTNAAYFFVLPAGVVAKSELVAADMMRMVLGTAGANAVSIAAMISIFAALNGSILSGSRVPYAMARDGYFFAPLGKVHAHHHTPGVAILALSGWSALLLIVVGGYNELFDSVIFASWILYGMTTASVLVLRRRQPDLVRPYRTLGYPIVPVVFVAIALALVVSTLFDTPRESLIGLTLIIAGLPFYRHWNRQRP